jgi:hypothetical protein
MKTIILLFIVVGVVKGIDNCSKHNNCESCANAGCGWCANANEFSSGYCYPGKNGEGCFNFIPYAQTVDQCECIIYNYSGYQHQPDCTSNENCKWCPELEMCTGNTTQPCW